MSIITSYGWFKPDPKFAALGSAKVLLEKPWTKQSPKAHSWKPWHSSGILSAGPVKKGLEKVGLSRTRISRFSRAAKSCLKSLLDKART
jgi:hypothetical protein